MKQQPSPLKSRFGWLMFWLSLGLSAVSVLALHLFAYSRGRISSDAMIFVVGFYLMIPFLFGLAGVCIAEAVYGKHHVVRKRGNRLISFAMAAVLGFGVGCGGQFLYSLEHNESVNREEGVADISLLFDCSTSMEECFDTAKEAAVKLVENCDADDRLQLIPFSHTVVEPTELVQMDAQGKEEMIAKIRSLQLISNTDFNAPLSYALDTLKNGGAVILMTDGQGNLLSRVKQSYYSTGIPVFSVSILESKYISRKDMIDFVEHTGGFDTVVLKDSSGSVDYTALLAALDGAYASASSFTSAAGVCLTYGANELTMMRVLIRLFIFTAYAVLTTFAYYFYLSWKILLVNLGTGVLMTAAVTLTGLLSPALSLAVSGILFILLYWTAFTQYRLVHDGRFFVKQHM